MIIISGSVIDINSIIGQYPEAGVERKIINILSSSNIAYEYNSVNQLKFELNLRKSIIANAKKLHNSKFSFRTFRDSKCNPNYWHRTNEGGFMLNTWVKPSNAIKDIYMNSSEYGTECATAIVIVYYGALVDIFPEQVFNSLFSGIYLMDWQHLDSDLGISMYRNLVDYLPGDCRYFNNPDVNPLTPEWQGENAIDLGDGTYYGHGIGIKTAEGIINALNRNRKSGAEISAYLTDTANRPNFKYLANIYYSFSPRLIVS